MLRAKLFFSALVLAAATAPSIALAQTTGSATVSKSGQPYPERLLPSGTNACGGPASDNSCVSTRPQNLQPLGISYQDCVDNQTLRFTVLVNGFTGSQNLQVWASLSSDCTGVTDRGGSGAAAATCWRVAGDIVAPTYNTATTVTFDVRVQDLVAWQQHPPFPVPSGVDRAGSEACNAQSSFAAVSMNVNFVPVDTSGNYAGTAYQYQINTDMVGPPPPAASGMGDTVGDTLINVTWTANSDADTIGYDIFIDPLPGGASVEASASEAGQKLVCPDTGTPVPTGDDSSGGLADGDDGSTVDGSGILDATTQDVASVPEASTPVDAGCYTINVGGTPPASANGYNCNDSILSSGVTQDSGTTTTQPVYDDAGNLISEGGVVEGSGGISTIPMQYAVGVQNGLTVADKAVGSYTITGLTNGVTYNVVVAAVDGYGNVGPPSAEVCDYPAPVNDFWQTYEGDGGGGGGFCALESVGAGGGSIAGVGCVLGAAALMRRRRRQGRR
jgi:hypothetical protein